MTTDDRAAIAKFLRDAKTSLLIRCVADCRYRNGLLLGRNATIRNGLLLGGNATIEVSAMTVEIMIALEQGVEDEIDRRLPHNLGVT